MKIQKPSLVRMVILTLPHPGGPGPHGELLYDYAAVVIGVKKDGVVNLRNFATNERVDDVPHSAVAKARTWRYPPRVDGEIEVPE